LKFTDTENGRHFANMRVWPPCICDNVSLTIRQYENIQALNRLDMISLGIDQAYKRFTIQNSKPN